MRPRVFPAEDRPEVAKPGADLCYASMRPRVFPAEDQQMAAAIRQGGSCFNEAAGIPRGRPAAGSVVVDSGAGASMRPRVFPAEDQTMTVARRPEGRTLQ